MIMNEANDNTLFERIVQRIDPASKLLRSWKMTGGVSAQVTALEVAQPDGNTRKLIVRQHGETDLKYNPHIAADEYKLLRQLHDREIPAPMAYDYDESATILPTPYVVIEYIEGDTVFAPADVTSYVTQLATQLTNLHRLDATTLDVAFLPQQSARYTTRVTMSPRVIDDTLAESRIRATLRLSLPPQSKNTTVLLHGDYWPGNILWRDAQLVGIIDWEDAALGDPLSDLGNARFEIMWALGTDAMQAFTQHYQSIMPLDYAALPYWDLYAALRAIPHVSKWAADATAEQQMRERHKAFTTQAFEKLSGKTNG
jgi:aminoglycoside phosphotransferase (APT) family kinase protein